MSDDWKTRRLLSKQKALAIGAAGWHSRGYLPHFDAELQTQTVTFRLFDSIPQSVLDQWRVELLRLPDREAEIERRKRLDAYLDQGHGSCFLKDDRLAEIVQNAMLHFDGERYALHAWVVMPNHVHVLFAPRPGHPMSEILHSWKSFTASKGNKLLQRKGDLWQREAFDRYIRDERHYASAIAYIENNPVKAGLCNRPEDWRWGSAYRRSKAEEQS